MTLYVFSTVLHTPSNLSSTTTWLPSFYQAGPLYYQVVVLDKSDGVGNAVLKNTMSYEGYSFGGTVWVFHR